MEKEKIKVLIIDDDPKIPLILTEGLGEKYQLSSARDGKEGLKQLQVCRPDLVLLDIKLPGSSGLDVLERIKNVDPRLDVIMLSGHGETKNVVESIRKGAVEFINKPFDIKELEIHLQTVLEKSRLKKELSYLREELKEKTGGVLIGDSQKMLEIKNLIEQVADSDLTVLIRGDSGTGKEIIARMLHNLSSRKNQAFVKVNCAAIPRDLLEAELFGYEKGAFTGAHKTKPGRFEVANKGTMFLDEIGDMPLDLQSKLLQVLEHQEFVRVGGLSPIKVDVRIVCATNKDLDRALESKLFRDDLYYRLNEINLFLPPLRERREDISLLVEHFLSKYGSLYNKTPKILSAGCMKLLENYNWPGNVRQLENLIKQIVVREDENIVYDLVKAKPLKETENLNQNTYSLKKRISQAVALEEKVLIREVLNKTNWNRRKAAQLLEISYRSLLYKIKEYKINDQNQS